MLTLAVLGGLIDGSNSYEERDRQPLLFQCAHLGIGFILNEFAESVEEVRYGGIHLLEAHFFSARASQSITAMKGGVRYDFLG